MIKLKFINQVLLLVLLVAFARCNVLDTIKSLPVDIPLQGTIEISGQESSLSQSVSFCIDSTDSFLERKEDITEITFVQASLETLAYSPSDMKGDIVIEVKDAMGNTLFKNVLKDVSPGDFAGSPYSIVLYSKDFNRTNDYLQQAFASGDEICFTVTLYLQIKEGTPPYSFRGTFNIGFEAKTAL